MRRASETRISLHQNWVADMLALESAEFDLHPNGSNGREASPTDRVKSSVRIQTMSEFKKFGHSMSLPRDLKSDSVLGFECTDSILNAA